MEVVCWSLIIANASRKKTTGDVIWLLVLLFLNTSCLFAQLTYKVRLTSTEGGQIVDVPAEKYVAAVVAGESSTFRSDEALKAMAVAARTYAARLRPRHAQEGFDFCATTHCQRVVLNDVNVRAVKAAAETKGLLLWAGSQPIFAAYARDCGGVTETARDVWPDTNAPYLVSKADPYCTRQGQHTWAWSASLADVNCAMHASRLNAPDPLRRILLLSRTNSGRAKLLSMGGQDDGTVQVSAGSFHFAIGRTLGWNTIRSNFFDVTSNGDRIAVQGRGEGHGVGLCQNGADQMGQEGFGYRDILTFYYPGTQLSSRASGLAWRQIKSGDLTLNTLKPEQDRIVLSLADRASRDLESRYHLGHPPPTQWFVYPDLDSFRNGTGEPGWVAAHTNGTKVEMQPVKTLQQHGMLASTVRHELLHVLIEQKAIRGIPVWFREGLVENLAGNHSAPVSADVRTPGNADLQQRTDRRRAEMAHAQSQRRVAELISSYGVGEILGWLTNGIPPAVLHSSTSSTPANKR